MGDNSFTDAPDMISNRLYSCCALVPSSNLHNNRPVVIAIGGHSGGVPEILDYTTTGATWEQIAAPPTDFDSSYNGCSATAIGSKAYMQFHEYVYEMTCEENYQNDESEYIFEMH